jgi:hypothetical protein
VSIKPPTGEMGRRLSAAAMGAGELHSYVYATGSFTVYSRQFGWLSPSLGISTCSVAMSAPVSYNVGYRRFSASDRPRPTGGTASRYRTPFSAGAENGRKVRVRGHHEGCRISGSGDDGESVDDVDLEGQGPRRRRDGEQVAQRREVLLARGEDSLRHRKACGAKSADVRHAEMSSISGGDHGHVVSARLPNGPRW